ncbi:hypothetical protein PTTG_30278, partial [Puccinia triticina 1-1 BBBD Race 1]
MDQSNHQQGSGPTNADRQDASVSSDHQQAPGGLEQRMDRMATSLEVLISIMKDTHRLQHPPPPEMSFGAPSAAPFMDGPNFARSAFSPNPAAPIPQLGEGKTYQSAGGHPQQGRPMPFPSHEHQAADHGNQEQVRVYLEPPKIAELWFSGDSK